jgi:hypothetical protein
LHAVRVSVRAVRKMPATSWAAILRFFNWTTPGDNTAAIGGANNAPPDAACVSPKYNKATRLSGQSATARCGVFTFAAVYDERTTT